MASRQSAGQPNLRNSIRRRCLPYPLALRLSARVSAGVQLHLAQFALERTALRKLYYNQDMPNYHRSSAGNADLFTTRC